MFSFPHFSSHFKVFLFNFVPILISLNTFVIEGEMFWHKILSVHDEGPVGKVGVMQAGDFLVEVH